MQTIGFTNLSSYVSNSFEHLLNQLQALEITFVRDVSMCVRPHSQGYKLHSRDTDIHVILNLYNQWTSLLRLET